MVSQESIAAQLKKIGFSQSAWGKAEVRELPHIILPDEEIFECVNGMYEGGFALLVATDVRVLLIDKKPFNYLTVEDLRFDMINEIDYNHRVFGAYVNISTGNRDLKFRSYNQTRLRKLINHVQNRMADIKRTQVTHQEGQYQHLQQINSHLQTYLIEQYKHQEELQRRLEEARRHGAPAAVANPAPPQPSPELADYLYANGLLREHEALTGKKLVELSTGGSSAAAQSQPQQDGQEDHELYLEGLREVFGGRSHPKSLAIHPFDVNPLRIAYSKLPAALRSRKFRRPSLHTSGEQAEAEPQPG